MSVRNDPHLVLLAVAGEGHARPPSLAAAVRTALHLFHGRHAQFPGESSPTLHLSDAMRHLRSFFSLSSIIRRNRRKNPVENLAVLFLRLCCYNGNAQLFQLFRVHIGGRFRHQVAEEATFGKAITSRMLSQPSISMTKRSRPKAMPPVRPARRI